MKNKVIVLMGRSGCGKGTQAKLIMERLKAKRKDVGGNGDAGILYIQTGQELREFIKGESISQKLCRDIYMAGGLMPEFLAVYTWINVLVQKFTGKETIIFDGTPRKYHEAGVFHSILSFYDFAKPYVINIDISSDEALKRLMARGRLDDNEDDIKNRLSWYETDVLPAIGFFEKNDAYTFLKIDGNRSVEEIFKEIVEKTGI